MKKLKLVWKILKSTNADKIVISFFIFILFMGFIFELVEPSINSYGDSLWYCFTVVSTIGFGDFYAVTTLGRLLTVLLSFYGIFVIALIPGIVVSFYMEFMKIKANESTATFLEKLEHLEDLSKEELAEISAKVREKKYKM
ncbi:potassium channel family protein [Niameybacter massiliensis]|uniref:Potassium channel family protein n=1 Tax=Holtiella tumoricola TaxID=3018743 RepID=A0AA42DNM1_9FIRM|nr:MULTISPECIES: potassium channel family protein [Lachnospirales]MDA3732081.1 potassium channel family protein [Holtiella tumoricola]